MKPLAKRIMKIIAAIAAIPIALIIFLVCISEIDSRYQYLKLPEICKNLPAHIDGMSPAFDARVQRIYAMPVAAAALETSLREQKFSLPDSRKAEIKADQYYAYAEYNFFPCDQTWVVEWTKAPGGMARNIRGRYNASCL